MSQDFLVRDDAGFSAQLDQFAAKLPTYATTLGVPAADVTQVTNDAAYFRWSLAAMNQYRSRAEDWTTYKNLLRKSPVTTALGVAPSAPTLPAAPTLVLPNIESRFRLLVGRIKKSNNYTEAIGIDLDIVASSSNQNKAIMKPPISLSLTAGQPLIVWKKDGMDGIELYKDSGDGNYRFLVFDARPNHLDTSQLPAIGQSAIWKYKAIYRFRDERIGEWSDEVQITVAGNI